MITKEEIEKIKIGYKKHEFILKMGIFLILFFVGFFAYSALSFRNDYFAFGSLIFAIVFFSSFFLYRMVLELFPTYIKLTDEGIKLPPSKNNKILQRRKIILGDEEGIIRYEWIELVILNEGGVPNLYYNIFFTKDGKKYLNHHWQRAIEDPIEFVKELRDRGIEVKILEPSLKHQKKYDYNWILPMVRGREWIW